MKKNEFNEEYAWYKRIETAYDDAEQAGDTEAVETARLEMKALRESIQAKGKDYARTFADLRDAWDRGNDCIDISEVVWDEQVPGLIERLRSFGIEKFTYSSTWSGAVETAWLFLQNGCKLEGLVELNGSSKLWPEEGWEKVHGHLFSIQ